jgi:hypothetical protein
MVLFDSNETHSISSLCEVCERCGSRSVVEAERGIFDYYAVMRRTESSDLLIFVHDRCDQGAPRDSPDGKLNVDVRRVSPYQVAYTLRFDSVFFAI